MRLVFWLWVTCMLTSATAAQLAWEEDPGLGTVTVREGGDPVLVFRYDDQLRDGVDPQYRRSGYIHPLYGLDGTELTDDFPQDHFHHRGIFWSWPRIQVRDQAVQTWHPSPLRQHFGKWLTRSAAPGQPVILSAENVWKLDGKEVVARETVTLGIHPRSEAYRATDVTLTVEAVGGPLRLLGAVDKGYGGLCIRGAPMFAGQALATNQGPLTSDSTNVPFQWADMSTGQHGLAILVHPDHPDYPPTWLIRNSYAGILNVSWPGLEPATLTPGQPVTLRYRLLTHRGNPRQEDLQQAYQDYLVETTPPAR